MKTKFRLLLSASVLGLALTLSSCVSPYPGPHEHEGAVVGAVGGGALGAIIGSQSGRPLEGAAIGGAIGALAGSSIGASRDQYYYGGRPYARPVYLRPGPRYGYHHRVYHRPVYGYRTYRPYYY